MSFIAGYLLGLGQGSPPVPTPSPLSLEGIKNLKTVATVTIGSFVFEIKEPTKLFAGAISTSSSMGEGSLQTAWYSSVIVNDSVAYIGSSGIDYDYLAWGKWGNYSTYYVSLSDFKIMSVNLDETTSSNSLPTIKVNVEYKKSNGYDEYVVSVQNSSGWDTLSAYSSSDIKFTNLSEFDYYQFVKAYTEARSANEPVINIL